MKNKMEKIWPWMDELRKESKMTIDNNNKYLFSISVFLDLREGI